MEAHLRRLIAVDGPIPVSRFMAEVLTHPDLGYYARPDALGGDFVTAPEISQMFGELVGLALAQHWLESGRPAAHLVELGPGRGTLMADMLRATRGVPGFDALDLHLVEASRPLRQVQAATLAGHTPAWHDGLASLPDGAWWLVANEYLDALPVRQARRLDDGWHEVLVAAGDDGLRFVLAPTAMALEAAAPAGATVELGPARLAAVRHVATRIAEAGGCALLIDYGPDDGPPLGTLQAVRRHRRQDVLDRPGCADLSAHVDFAACVAAARAAGAATHGPVAQGDWLRRLGVEVRAAQLAGEDATGAVGRALQRLTAPDGMGTLFKVLALTAPGAPAPAGFQ